MFLMNMYENCGNEDISQKDLLRNKSPLDEAYASLSRGQISEIDDSNCENIQIQFRASSTPRQPSVSHSRLKPHASKSRAHVEHDLEFGKNYQKTINPSNFTLAEDTLSSGFNGDISLDLNIPENLIHSTSQPSKSLHFLASQFQSQQSDSQPLDLRTNQTKPCACTDSIHTSTNPTRFDIQTLLNSSPYSASMSFIPQNCESVPSSNHPTDYLNHLTTPSHVVLQAMTEFFILLQQQQQQQLQQQIPFKQKLPTVQPPQLHIDPNWSSKQSYPIQPSSLACINTLAPALSVDTNLNLQTTTSQTSWPTRTTSSNPHSSQVSIDLGCQVHPAKSAWPSAHSETDATIHSRPPKPRSDQYSISQIRDESSESNSSDSIAESRELRPEDNCENESANKGPAIFYYPEPGDSKEKIRNMIEQNDPRLKYVNDGAAIRNPFAVDRKTQLNHLTALLCVKLDNNCYLCKGCNRTTSRLRPMQQHLLSHSASKFNLCVRCLKGFNDKYDMKRHTRKHTSVRPYVCPECNRSFSQRCSLEGHRRKIHKIKLDYTPNQRREVVRVCENCGYACSRLGDMVNHTATYHPSSTSLPRLRRQLSRHEDRLKRIQKNSSNLKPFSNLLNTHE